MTICVFCKKNPINKNKEHVLPQWLIKLTGDPKRKIDIIDFKINKISISFDQFTFPACEKCNTEYLKLESIAQNVVKKILNNEEISSTDIEILFDWIDKVRIGIWLGSYIYNKNFCQINPKFGIKTREKKDRVLFLLKTKEPSLRLNFSGFTDPLFQYIPCYLGLYINGLMIISASSDFLLKDSVPLPNFEFIKKINKQKALYQQKTDVPEKLNLPYFGKKASIFFQLNYPKNISLDKDFEKYKHYLNNNLTSSKILFVKNKNIQIYPEKQSKLWMPELYEDYYESMIDYGKKILRFRDWVLKKVLSTFLDKKSRDMYKFYLKTKH